MSSRDEDYKRALEEGIRRQFQGKTDTEVKPKRRREQFMMQWHDEDDTSDKLDAGVDMRKQRKESQYMENLLKLREQAVGNEVEDNP